MTIKSDIELLLQNAATLAEGPCWLRGEEKLLWVDIVEKKLHRFDPSTNKDEVFYFDQMIGSAVPKADGGILLAMQDGLYSFDEITGALEGLAYPERHMPGNRFNDGKCDPAGRFWVGSLSMTGESKAGSLYCLHPNLQVTKSVSSLTISNGLGWSPDYANMYLIDSKIRKVFAFDYDLVTGNIANRKTIVEYEPEDGLPDGMAVDERGMLWIAHWGGGKITCLDPGKQKVVGVVELPAKIVTSCAFGGKNNDELYVTTAKDDEKHTGDPYGGSLFRIKLGITGMPTFEFQAG